MIWLEKEDGRADGGRTAFEEGESVEPACISEG